MSADDLQLPLIDLDGYLNPTSDEDKLKVIAQVRDACEQYGFFQVTGHGVPLSLQQKFLASLDRLFKLPQEEKMKMSYLKNPCRRGYEASGMSLRDGDPMPDAKEAFYLGREDPKVELSGFYGPNVWPELPDEEFRGPVWEYYQKTSDLGKCIWEILLQGLGYSPDLMTEFAKRPLVQMKMIRYPTPPNTLPGQFGVGPHNDFGGVTVLLQEPEKHGLEVWMEDKQDWLSVLALEDIYVINCGDMVQKWSGGKYKSVRHRVVNKAMTERLSCATFWHGDVYATNPLNPDDPNKETVGQLLVKRFRNQMTLPKEAIAQVEAN
ncbi:uncharacterized protein N7459_005698 [Penicillium hispanicum]|uniref:uncharacterized protein n=1 Tax=Penicillium hispanicum TaxID=1080232 RepID=UPI0025417C06|nr:uncharacterized protein N7459_005698 [Penicillium hispanicum]KAJ5579713.1 hypothetical protein N7459_005698 [Penicillium hispanicum]